MSSAAARAPHRRGTCPIVTPMPELPEVETVARDLRRRLLPEGGGPGPEITGARVAWTRTLRDGDPEAFVRGVTGRRIEAIGRRGKQVVIDLDGGAFLTVHLKMTGQLFVVPASLPVDPYERLALSLDDGRELRFRDVRKFGRIGLYGADDDPFDGIGPEPLDHAVHAPGVPVADPRPPRAAQAAARRPGVRRRRRQHLRRRGAVALEAPPAAVRAARSARPTSARLYHHIREILAEAIERRGSSIDDYTAPDGDGEMQERLDVYQRTGQPCRRCGRPIRRIVIGIRATHFCSWCQRLPAAQRPAAAPLLATMTPRPGAARDGPHGPPLGGARRRRGAGPHDRRGGAAPVHARRARRRRPRPAARRRGRGAAREPRPPRGRRPRDRHVRHPRPHHGRDRARRAGRARRPERRRQDDAAADRVGPRRARPRDGRAQARPQPRAAQPGGALRRGVHGRAGPARRRPPRRGAPRAHGRGARRARARRPRRRARTTPSSSTGSTSSAATRWTSAWTRRCSGLGLRPRRVAPAADRAVRRPADARGARPARHRRPGPDAARRAHQPPRHRRDRVARGAPPAPLRRAARRVATTARSSTRPSPASGSSATAG